MTVPIPKILKANPFSLAIYRRTHRLKRDALIAAVGARGDGKSWWAVGEATRQDPTFLPAIRADPSTRILFTAKEYADAFKHCKKGQAYLFDEAGIGADHRLWYSQSNQILRHISQIQRHRRLTMFFTTPSIEFIDKDLRSLFYALVHVKGYDEDTKVTYTKVHKIYSNPASGDILKPYWLYKDEHGDLVKLRGGIIFRPPNKEATQIYEDYSTEWKRKFELRKGIEFVKLEAELNKPKKLTPDEVVPLLWPRREEFKNMKGDYNKEAICGEYKIGRSYVERVLFKLKQKEQEILSGLTALESVL